MKQSDLNYARLNGAVDIDMMQGGTVAGIGVGGANGLYEDLVRCGAGTLRLLDFDDVDDTNLCSQGWEQEDIGTPKVDALGRRFRNINTSLNYQGINGDFLKMSESEVDKLVEGADVLLLMTDSFHAQARGNKVALRNKIPAVFAMVYENGRCAEISFIIPGVTPACHRCAVSPRYEAYANDFENDVGSVGSTIFQTRYINACLGLVTMAVLHRDTVGFEFSNWFGEDWDRNFVQVRMNPKYGRGENDLFEKIHGSQPRSISFDSIWQKIEPETAPKYESCPDCGGLGDLSHINVKHINTAVL